MSVTERFQKCPVSVIETLVAVGSFTDATQQQPTPEHLESLTAVSQHLLLLMTEWKQKCYPQK